VSLTQLAAARWDRRDDGGSEGLRALSGGTVAPARSQVAKRRPANPVVLASACTELSKLYGFRERGKVGFELTCEAPLAAGDTRNDNHASDGAAGRAGSVKRGRT
jgi:hypothetical protein